MVDTYNRLLGATATTVGKTPVRAATTANVTLSGYQTVDGVSFGASDDAAGYSMRVLVQNQSDPTENGIYLVNSGTWTRVPDFDGNTDFVKGTTIYVTSGNTYANRLFFVSSADPQSVGVNSITFTQFAGENGITRAQIATVSPQSLRFYTIDGAPWIHGSSSGPMAIQDVTGQWWQIDVSAGVNVLWFGASTAANAATNATAFSLALATGRDVYVPGSSSSYSVTSISMNSPGQLLYGDGTASSGGTTLTMTPGTGDAITVGSSSGYVSGMRIKDIKFGLSSQTGGNGINATKVKYFILDNVFLDTPYQGVLVTSGTTITLNKVTCASVQSGYALKAVGTDSDPINVITIKDWTCSPLNTGASNRPHGIWIEGSVDTTDIFSAGNTHMGRGLWVTNSGGNTNTPSFITSQSFQSDFSEKEAIRIEAGGGFWFDDFYAHGSQTQNGVYIASGVFDVAFGLGECTGHYLNGMSVNGDGFVLAGTTVARNSVFTSNTYDGVAISSTANDVVIDGCQIGHYNGSSGLQRYGISIDPAATNVALGVNNYNGNVSGPFTGIGAPTATMSRYACATAGADFGLDNSAVQQSHTGDVTETQLSSTTVPANSMGANGYVDVEWISTQTNSANNKIFRCKFGGTIAHTATLTTTASDHHKVRIYNRNATNSQVANASINNAGGWGSSATANTTMAIDTTADVALTITGQLANTGETVTLEAYTVKVFYKP